MALTITPVSEIGTPCPDFQIQDLAGATWSLSQIKNGEPFLVMFICNHCPYVQAIEERLITLGLDLKKLNVNVLAISSNDPAEYPEDAPENLWARAQEKNYSFSYAHDADQSVARLFGAVCTPDFFLYDKSGILRYRGRLDDSWKDVHKVTRRELFEAVLTLKENKTINSQTPSMGCSIKWKVTP
ncbi:MAG: thioredoxin family protein [Bdellovibrionia bacterium]